MSYEINIPPEIRPQIIEVINKYSNKFRWLYEDMKYVMTIYYRYIARIHQDETVESRVDKDISCSNCCRKAVWQVKKQIEKWNDEAAATKANQ